jgi:hypothetical protein
MSEWMYAVFVLAMLAMLGAGAIVVVRIVDWMKEVDREREQLREFREWTNQSLWEIRRKVEREQHE